MPKILWKTDRGVGVSLGCPCCDNGLGFQKPLFWGAVGSRANNCLELDLEENSKLGGKGWEGREDGVGVVGGKE